MTEGDRLTIKAFALGDKGTEIVLLVLVEHSRLPCYGWRASTFHKRGIPHMALSPEIQSAVDEIRRNRSLVKSLQAERDLWKQTALDAQAKIAATALSPDDKAALQREIGDLDALSDELEGASAANTVGPVGAEAGSEPVAPPNDPFAPRPDPLPGTGQNGPVPLMPNSAFDPNPTASVDAGNAGQPGQPAAIETAGGFIIGGGGVAVRAPDTVEAVEEPAVGVDAIEPAAEAGGAVVEVPPANEPEQKPAGAVLGNIPAEPEQAAEVPAELVVAEPEPAAEPIGESGPK